MEEWDLIIVGSGPAGYTAGIYAVRYNLKTLIIGLDPHGLIGEMFMVENYPGFRAIPGTELMEKFKEHYIDLGGNYKQTMIVDIEKKEEGFILTDAQNQKYLAKTIILATGTDRRKLQIKGENELFGKGISYCSTCDGPFTKGKKVIVIGGGHSAFASALLLKQYTDDVSIMNRSDKFKASPFWVNKAKEKKINFIMNAKPLEFKGKEKLEAVIAETKEGIKEFPTDFVFVEIGHIPKTELLVKLKGEIDERGFIKTNERMETNVKGVFAAGDCTNQSSGFAQVITACSEGAIAAKSAYEFITR